MSSSYFREELKTFLGSNFSFKIIYNTSNGALVSPLTNRILVLDSSFNPPHRAHCSLVVKSALFKFPSQNEFSVSTINTKSVLLLLSLNNADKKQADLSSYVHRLEMVKLLAGHISDDYGLACAIGLTDKSLFVDKMHAIGEGLKREFPTRYNAINMTFLLGFDTLVRLLDSKYYEGNSLEETLGPFFDRSSCFVLSRDGKEYSQQYQKEYVEKIRSGKFDGQIPPSWADHIFIVSGDDSLLSVSSSEVRALAGKGDDNWERYTFADIAEYIKSKGLYRADD
ncbi:DEKNAAC105643 [Brettanomyces naardenensis]|uniref:DEKNAAC105643 n=1 Tax=Brettanomyces naardenensis TaxID=13370 RepID=A0A448YTV1_BRENA|nr:DEKNAAC105643 [Brettanomyces naardenensis]